MSITCYVLRVSPHQIAKLKADPSLTKGLKHLASHLEGGRSVTATLAELKDYAHPPIRGI